MFWNLTNVTVLAVVIGLAYWLGPKIVRAFRRFDAENEARIREQWQDRRDHTAHIRHSVAVAGEQVEDVVEIADTDPRTGEKVTRYVFEGEWFATRDEAEQVRVQKIADITRGFYRDLPRALAARKGDERLN